MMKKCCNFFKNSYIYSVQTGSKRQFNLEHADIILRASKPKGKGHRQKLINVQEKHVR